MKKVTIIGAGLGIDTITSEAREAILRADVLIGAPRFTKPWENPLKRNYTQYLPKDVMHIVTLSDAREFAVLVSGDVGFYSAASGLIDALADYEPRLIPGISSVNAFFAKLKLPWQDAAFISAHGRSANIVDTVRRHRLTFCLTGGNINEIGADLCNAGFNQIKTHIGENLGTEHERVYEAVAEDLARGSFPPLTVLLFINEAFDASTPCGLPDNVFARVSGIPMTKSETRAIVLSKLRLHPNSICWDVGAGSGSVTVEMALAAYKGHVYAVERREEGVALIKQNGRAFHIGNITAVCGDAPDALQVLPAPDSAFIGGSNGKLPQIIDAVLQKNPHARIALSAVTIETVGAAIEALAKARLDANIVQLQIARGKQAGNSHMLEAQNPITIISAGGIA